MSWFALLPARASSKSCRVFVSQSQMRRSRTSACAKVDLSPRRRTEDKTWDTTCCSSLGVAGFVSESLVFLWFYKVCMSTFTIQLPHHRYTIGNLAPVYTFLILYVAIATCYGLPTNIALKVILGGRLHKHRFSFMFTFTV